MRLIAFEVVNFIKFNLQVKSCRNGINVLRSKISQIEDPPFSAINKEK